MLTNGAKKAPAIELTGGYRVEVTGLDAWPPDATSRRVVASGRITLVEKHVQFAQTSYHLRRR